MAVLGAANSDLEMWVLGLKYSIDSQWLSSKTFGTMLFNGMPLYFSAFYHPRIAIPASEVRSIGFISLGFLGRMYIKSKRAARKPPHWKLRVASPRPAKNSTHWRPTGSLLGGTSDHDDWKYVTALRLDFTRCKFLEHRPSFTPSPLNVWSSVHKLRRTARTITLGTWRKNHKKKAGGSTWES